jgi:hypothetical protein
MATLQLRNVEKVYGNAFKAVHGIDLEVKARGDLHVYRVTVHLYLRAFLAPGWNAEHQG